MTKLNEEFIEAANQAAIQTEFYRQDIALESDPKWQAFKQDNPLIYEVLYLFSDSPIRTCLDAAMNSDTHALGITLFSSRQSGFSPSTNLLIKKDSDCFTILENIQTKEGIFVAHRDLVAGNFKLSDCTIEHISSYAGEKAAALHLAKWYGKSMPFHNLLVEYRQNLEKPQPPTQG